MPSQAHSTPTDTHHRPAAVTALWENGSQVFLENASKYASNKHIVRGLCKCRHHTWVFSSTIFIQNSHAARHMNMTVIRQPSPSSFAWFWGLSGPAEPWSHTPPRQHGCAEWPCSQHWTGTCVPTGPAGAAGHQSRWQPAPADADCIGQSRGILRLHQHLPGAAASFHLPWLLGPRCHLCRWWSLSQAPCTARLHEWTAVFRKQSRVAWTG